MKKTVEGVFLLLETEDKEMIFVEENNECNKSRKKQGQYFVPAGTIEDGENREETIDREFEEETGLNGAATIVEKTVKKIGELLLETEDYSIKAHVYTGSIPSHTKIKMQKFNSHEIKSITIQDPKKILNQEIDKIRPGLVEALLLKHGIQSDIIVIKNGVYANQEETRSKIEQLQVLYKDTQGYS